VATFVDCYNRYLHNAIKFVTPHQRHSGTANAICKQRADVYEKARRATKTLFSRHMRCCSQPVELWTNKPTEEPEPILELPLIQAA